MDVCTVHVPEGSAGVADPVQALVDDFLHLQGPLQQLRVFAALLLHKYRTSILILRSHMFYYIFTVLQGELEFIKGYLSRWMRTQETH